MTTNMVIINHQPIGPLLYCRLPKYSSEPMCRVAEVHTTLLPCDTMLAQDMLWPCFCLSVCLSVCHLPNWCSIGMAK